MERLVVIRTQAGLEELTEYLKDKEYIAFDTETTGITKESNIIGLSVCAELDVGYYVVLSEYDKIRETLLYLETSKVIVDFIKALVPKKLIMHNATFDCWMVENNYNIKLMPSVHTDTLLLGHILDENRSNGLKELGVVLFGEDSRTEQIEMTASIHANGGSTTQGLYELYKADSELIARYGAKDAILTLKVFYQLIPELYEQGLDEFFYSEETMPLLRGPTYEMNTAGLRIDPDKLSSLKHTLEVEILETQAYVLKEIQPHVAEKYPGTNKANHFNIGSSKQLSWLLFIELGNLFNLLTKEGKELCKHLNLKLPYSNQDKRIFLHEVEQRKDQVWKEATYNYKTKKTSRPKKINDVWNYLACGKESLMKFSHKYGWVKKLLEYAKAKKLLNTYVEGIQNKMQYNVINPSFLQHGTTSGRYSCKKPNFQNLPRDDKRIKACIVSRKGKVFVGADYSQLEPRVFAAMSQDKRLMECFSTGEDFYSVIGAGVFGVYNCSLRKDDEGSFAKKYPEYRQAAKVVALSATYGTTAPKMAPALNKTIEEAQEIIDDYFHNFPKVKEFMLNCHKEAKEKGRVLSLFGRPRRIPKAIDIRKLYGNQRHSDLPYDIRNVLNLAVNHTVQSTAASIMNRAAILCWKRLQELKLDEVKIVMQVHDELILECPEEQAQQVARILKDSMESASKLPGVALLAEPKIANNLADLK